MKEYDIAIIGGGPGGLACAVAAYDAGVRSIVILERDGELGGILNQCIHAGFGLHTFKQELTGPEYAQKYIDMVRERGIDTLLDTMVLSLSSSKEITAINRSDGMFSVKAKAIVLCMGCRERARGALNIPGYRPAGIYSAGTAQRLVNIMGFMPGKDVVILGSGDIGLIMARRMRLEGANVKLVAELMPYSSGLKRNIVQCLEDYDIPLKLSHTVVDIHGKERLEGVTVAKVDEKLAPIAGSEEYYACDTLLLSCGLIPENELSRELGIEFDPVTGGPAVNESFETGIAGIYAAGNALHVHDLVDNVSEEAAIAGRNAAEYVLGGCAAKKAQRVKLRVGNGIRYAVPAYIDPKSVKDKLTVRMRVATVMKNKRIAIYINGEKALRQHRKIMSPGEMERMAITRDMLSKYENITDIVIKTED